MNILGMGLVFCRGRGVGAFRQALIDGWKQPDEVAIGASKMPAYLVDLQRIQDKSLLKKMRRADKLSIMSVQAAADAVEESGLDAAQRKRLGVIVATAFGAHVTTFDFLDGILDYGEAAASPTFFSNSVHNAAASYISQVLEIQGPTLTVTRFFFSFSSALQLADAWLKEGRLEHVLVGGVDQFGNVMGYVCGNRLALAKDGVINPLTGTAVPGEGAAFFVVSRTASGKGYASVSKIEFGRDLRPASPSSLDILDADGLVPDQSVYAPFLQKQNSSAVYAPIYGSMMTGSAFSVAAAALSVREDVRFPDPGIKTGSNFARQGEAVPSSGRDLVRCIRYDCSGLGSSIQITKAGSQEG